MEINLKLTDMGEDGAKLESDLDGGALPEGGSLTPAVIALLGFKMLFESGDVWSAGMKGIEILQQGGDPMEFARAIRDRMAAAQAEAKTEAESEDA